MIFVKSDDLKVGMRLARPIYNRDGVLLYERNSRLTAQSINSIHNFGLIGLFILEPAEPVPPMTQDDVDFERFQTMFVFSIKAEMDTIIRTERTEKMQVITANIIKNYGHMDKKINFIQNLRSKEDYIYKHTLNVAILCALLTHTMNLPVSEQQTTVTAALAHDLGKLTLPEGAAGQDSMTQTDDAQAKHADAAGQDLLGKVFVANPDIKRVCMQSSMTLRALADGKKPTDTMMMMGSRILSVAETFDSMTAMRIEKEPESEVAALKFLLDNPAYFDKRAVLALINSINILTPGVSVELSNGQKAVVLNENTRDVLRPMVLTFSNNTIVDLGDLKMYSDLEIKDIMKTMDNRYIMDWDALKEHGIEVEKPVYLETPEEKDAVPLA